MSHEGGAAPLSLGEDDDPASAATLLRFIRQGRSFSGHERHCCFLNTGGTRFANVAAVTGLDMDDDGRGAGIVDWDNDGDLDLWVTNRSGPQLRFLCNDYPPHHRFVAVRLRGTSCNRDAIGARVEIVMRDATDSQRSVKSVRAGDGYLAQSTKWLHFGLGTSGQIEKAVVKWPGGAEEAFRGLRANHRYELVQGTRRARAVSSASATTKLSADPLHTPSPNSSIATYSVSGMPVPQLTYRTPDGRSQQVALARPGRWLLLTIWASWCQPCLEDLAELRDQHERLTDAGLDILALSVDGISTSNDGSRAVAISMIEHGNFPFRVGWADAKLIDKLQLTNDHLYDLRLPLPVPCSFLIDEKGYLVALYKGRISLDRLVKDLVVAQAPPEQRRMRAVPFHGLWKEAPQRLSLVPMLNQLVDRGYLNEADDFVRRIGTEQKSRLLPAITRLAMAFYRMGQRDKAAQHFRVISRMDPAYDGVEFSLGRHFQAAGDVATAEKLYRQALAKSPTSRRSRNNLAWILAVSARAPSARTREAVQLAQQLVSETTDQADPNLLDTLAVAYAADAQFERAIATAEQGLTECRKSGQIELAEKIGARLERFRAGKPLAARTTEHK